MTTNQDRLRRDQAGHQLQDPPERLHQRTDNQRMKRLQTEDLPDQRGPRTFGQTDTEVNDVAGSNPMSPCSSDACSMAQTASISDVSKDDEEDNRHSSAGDTNLSNIFKVKSPVNVLRRPQQPLSRGPETWADMPSQRGCAP